MSILEVRGLKKVYTTRFGGAHVQALTDVTFTVEGTELNRVTSVLAERCCADAAQPGA